MPVFTGTITSPATLAAATSTYAQNVASAINAFGAWTAYTPSWTSSGTAPSLGNGTLVGSYTQIEKTVFLRLALTIGSTTTVGTLAYSLSLPVASVAGGFQQILDASYFDSSTGFYYRGQGRIYSGASTISRSAFVDGASGTAGWSATVPVVPATSDVIIFTGSYEAA